MTDARREQMLKELASDLRDRVQDGDITDMDANEWYNRKADQWASEAIQSAGPVLVAHISEYGLRQKLSNSIMVF